MVTGVDLALLTVGFLVSALLGLALGLQMRRSQRRASRLEQFGSRLPGTIESAESVGRYNTYTQVTVAVEGGSFVETVPSSEVAARQWEVGRTVPTQVLSGPPRQGRIERPVEASQYRSLGVGVAVLCSILWSVAVITL